MKKVLFYDELIYLPEEFLNEFESYKFKSSNLTHFELLNRRCNILLSRSTLKINRNLLSGVPLYYYGTATAGFDHVDTEYLKSRDIDCFIASGSNSNSVAEYVMINIYEYVKKHSLNYNDISVGIIGFGNIGKKVAYYCSLFDIKILVNDPPLRDNSFDFPDYVIYREIEELISNSDIITNHVPYSEKGKYKTKNLLDNNLQNIKDNILFIHSSRGGIVNENSLLKYTYPKNSNLIIDVWENEPDVNQNLINASIVSTPHIAGHSINAKLNASQMILDDLFMKGYINKNYFIDNKKSDITNRQNIIDMLEKSINNRKIYEDSSTFKESPEKFTELRRNYPPRSESLFLKN